MYQIIPNLRGNLPSHNLPAQANLVPAKRQSRLGAKPCTPVLIIISPYDRLYLFTRNYRRRSVWWRSLYRESVPYRTREMLDTSMSSWPGPRMYVSHTILKMLIVMLLYNIMYNTTILYQIVLLRAHTTYTRTCIIYMRPCIVYYTKHSSFLLKLVQDTLHWCCVHHKTMATYVLSIHTWYPACMCTKFPRFSCKYCYDITTRYDMPCIIM